LSVLKWSHAHLKRRWQEFVGAISYNTSFTHCPVLNLTVAWFRWNLVGNWTFSTIFGVQHCCRFRKRMQLNMGGLRLNTLLFYYLFHHFFLYFLSFFFNFPTFCSLYFFFFYLFFFYFLLQPMLIFTGLSWCHKFQLHLMSLIPQIKGTLIKIQRFKMKSCPSKKKMTRVCGSNIT